MYICIYTYPGFSQLVVSLIQTDFVQACAARAPSVVSLRRPACALCARQGLLPMDWVFSFLCVRSTVVPVTRPSDGMSLACGLIWIRRLRKSWPQKVNLLVLGPLGN